MEPQYLRVRNWSDLQHYGKRAPRWIKLYRRLLDDDEFMQLDEFEQWQLVRIWLLASRSETVMMVDGREVPLLPNDETFVRRGIKSIKKVPLEKFIRVGFLEVYGETEIASRTVKESRHSASRNAQDPPSDARDAPFRAQARGAEQSRGLEESLLAVPLVSRDAAPAPAPTAPASAELEIEIGKLLELNGCDDNSRTVVSVYAKQLPFPAVADIRLRAEEGHKGVRWAVAAMQKQIEERNAA